MKTNKTNSKSEEIKEIEYQPINLLTSPISTISTLFIILSEQLGKFLKFLVRNKSLIILMIAYIGLSLIQGKHSEVNKENFYTKIFCN